MKSLPQVVALLRYQAASNPWIFIFPLAFGLQGAIPTTRTYYGSLEMAISSTTLMAWIPLFFAAYAFAPQVFAGTSAATKTPLYSEEFLLTRAVDRSNVFWSRLGIYALLIFSLSAIWLIPAIIRPSISLQVESAHASHYLSQIPGSHIIETTKVGRRILLLPLAMVWVKLWCTALLLYAALLAPAFMLLISTWRWKRWIFWLAFIFSIFSTLAVSVGKTIRAQTEPAFLWSLNHPFLFLAPLVAIGFFTMRYCRQKYVAQQVEG